LLCSLGDASVETLHDCDVDIPPGYESLCERWMCGQENVDRCFFTHSAKIKVPESVVDVPGDSRHLHDGILSDWKDMCPANSSWQLLSESWCAVDDVCSATYFEWFRFAIKEECFVDDQGESWQNEIAEDVTANLTDTRSETVDVASAHLEVTQCMRLEPFWQCDDSDRMGATLSLIWNQVGKPLIAKFASPLSGTHSATGWVHCGDEGDLCFCTGDVRFGTAADWSEVLHVHQGFISCSAAIFGATTGHCECKSEPSSGPLTVPGGPGVASASRESHARKFINGGPYQPAHRNGVRYDFASVTAGARLVTHSRDVKRAKALLTSDLSEYMLADCQTGVRPWFVVSLLESIYLEHIGLVFKELFASSFRHLQILGSMKYPTEQWRLLGEIETSPTDPFQLFDISSSCRHHPDKCWVLFIKVRALSHHEVEDNPYCAITRFQAFGSTQMTYIEERLVEEAVDHRVEPTVANVTDWHDQAVRGALISAASPPEDTPPEPLLEVRAVLEDNTVQDAPNAELPSQGNVVDHLFDLLKQAPKWLVDRKLPLPGAEDLDTDPERSIPPDRSESERDSLTMTEVLSVLNATGVIPDDTVTKLGSALGKLQSTMATAQRPASQTTPTNGASSAPALVRIRDDLRFVQDSQVALDESIKSVTTGLGAVLMLVLETLHQHSLRVRSIEVQDQAAEVVQDEAVQVDTWERTIAAALKFARHKAKMMEVERFPASLRDIALLFLLYWTFVRPYFKQGTDERDAPEPRPRVRSSPARRHVTLDNSGSESERPRRVRRDRWAPETSAASSNPTSDAERSFNAAGRVRSGAATDGQSDPRPFGVAEADLVHRAYVRSRRQSSKARRHVGHGKFTDRHMD